MIDYRACESTAVEEVPVQNHIAINDMIEEARATLTEANYCLTDIRRAMTGEGSFDGASEKPKCMQESMEDLVALAHLCMETAKKMHAALF